MNSNHRPRAGERVGVAVVGAGYWGPNLIRNFGGSEEFDLRWVCDLDEARGAQGPRTELHGEGHDFAR